MNKTLKTVGTLERERERESGNLKNKKERAITLIALTITIVILIILAGVLVSIALGSNGLFGKAKTAKEMYANAQDYEQTEIAKYSNEIDEIVKGNREIDLSEILNGYSVVASDGTEWNRNNISTSYTAEKDGIAIGVVIAFSSSGTGSTSTAITSTGTVIQPILTDTVEPRNRYAFAIYKLTTGDTIQVTGQGTQADANSNTACGIILFKEI